MKKNAGFSLIEMIVVVAILAVLAAMGASMFLSRSDWYSKRANERITTALSETRTNALARESAWMKLSYDATKKAYIISTSYGADQELKGDFEIYYETDDPANTEYDLKTAAPLILSFERGTGRFRALITSVDEATGTFTYANRTVNAVDEDSGATTSEELKIYCTKIRIVQGSDCEYDITLYKLTGRFESERKKL